MFRSQHWNPYIFFLQALLQLSVPFSYATCYGGEAIGVLSVISTEVEHNGGSEPLLYRVFLRNDAASTQNLSYCIVPNADQTTRCVTPGDADVLWWRAIPPVVAPGQFSEIRVKMARVDRRLNAMRIQSDLGTHVTAALPAKEAAARLHGLKWNDAENAFQLYWSNAAEQERKILQVYLNGQLSKVANTGGIVSRNGKLACLKLGDVSPVIIGSIAFATVVFDDQTRLSIVARTSVFSLGFEQAPFGIFSERNPLLFQDAFNATDPKAQTGTMCLLASCLMHKPATPQKNAWAALRQIGGLAEKAPVAIPTVHLCRQDIDDGLPLMGQLADRTLVNAWPLPLQNPAAYDFEAPARILATAHQAVGSGGVVALIPIDDGTDPMLVQRTLLAMAHGCSGVAFRLSNGKGHQDVLAARTLIASRLQMLLPLFKQWSGAMSVARLTSGDATIGAWWLQLAPTQFAVVLVDGYPFPRERKCEIPLPLEKNTKVTHLQEISGTLHTQILIVNDPDAPPTFSIDQFKTGAIVLVDTQVMP